MNIAQVIQHSELVIQNIETERANNAQLGNKAEQRFETLISQTEAVESLVKELGRQLIAMKAAFAAEIRERDKALAAIIQDDEATNAEQ